MISYYLFNSIEAVTWTLLDISFNFVTSLVSLYTFMMLRWFHETNRIQQDIKFTVAAPSGCTRHQAAHVIRLHTPSGCTRHQTAHAIRLHTPSGCTRHRAAQAIRLHTSSAAHAIRLLTSSGCTRHQARL